MDTINSITDPVDYFGKLLGLDRAGVCALVRNAIPGVEDGEVIFERKESESVSLDDRRVEAPSLSVDQGFGLRRVNGESVLYGYANEISKEEIVRFGDELAQMDGVKNSFIAIDGPPECAPCYSSELASLTLTKRVRLLRDIDRYARKDSAVTNVMATIARGQVMSLVVRVDGAVTSDVRPMSVLSVAVQCEDGKKREMVRVGIGGRHDYGGVKKRSLWKPEVDRAIRIAKEKLRAVPCPSGEMPVVLGPGWAGVLLHEAIGHGLEGDAVWHKTTVFADLLGTRVASDLVTVVDDGTIVDARGSLVVDDEGTSTERTVLIQNGVLVGFMHDRQSARLLRMCPTGNGRRESFEHPPIVRMRNTLMLSGNTPPEEILARTEHGLYIESFGGGQVDPVTGQFVFSCDHAYKIVNGKLGEPVVGATLIGNCATVLLHVDLVGNDSRLGGVGTCGKDGQQVPVGIGQPTLRLSGGVAVGGTALTQTRGSE